MAVYQYLVWALMAIPLLFWNEGAEAQVAEKGTLPHELTEIHGRDVLGSLHQAAVSAIDLQADGQFDVRIQQDGLVAAPADTIAASLDSEAFRKIALEVLERNPGIAAARARGRSAVRSARARRGPPRRTTESGRNGSED